MRINERGKINSEIGRGGVDGGFLGHLRTVSLIAAVAGAGGAVGLMLHVGRRNDSRVLLSLFVIWVLSPFTALILSTLISKRWSGATRATLYSATLVIAIGSLGVYGYVAFSPPRTQAASVFVIVPPASLLLFSIVVPAAALISRRLTRRGVS